MGALSSRLLFAAMLCAPNALGVPANPSDDSRPPRDRAVEATAAAAPETSSPIRPAKGRFLVASHKLADPNFSETVVLLLAYEPAGAMGIVINRPSDVRLTSVLQDIEELRDRPDRVYLGGPVAENLLLVLVRAPRQPESSEAVFEDVYVSGSRAALRKALGKAGKRNRVRGYAGHAGWGPGQLDREIARGDWHVTTADPKTIFDTEPSAIWPKLVERFSGEWTRREVPTEDVPLPASVPSQKFATEFRGAFRRSLRCSSSEYCPTFVVVAPCERRKSLTDFRTELLRRDTRSSSLFPASPPSFDG